MPPWMQVMISRKRKSIPLCRRCHDDVHYNRPKLKRQGNRRAGWCDKYPVRFGGGPGEKARNGPRPCVYPALNVVTSGKPKMLRGLGQKGTVAGTGSCFYPVMDTQRYRRIEST